MATLPLRNYMLIFKSLEIKNYFIIGQVPMIFFYVLAARFFILTISL